MREYLVAYFEDRNLHRIRYKTVHATNKTEALKQAHIPHRLLVSITYCKSDR